MTESNRHGASCICPPCMERSDRAFTPPPEDIWRNIITKRDGDNAYVSGDQATLAPTVVTLCGSTRFSAAFREANLRETLAGHIVLSIGCDMRSDTEIFGGMTDDELAEVKRRLDDLHKRKIDLSDEILVLNVGGYVGESTRSEVHYALTSGKRVRWLEQGQVTA